MAESNNDAGTAGRIAAECLGFRVRLLNRAVTAVYDEALRPHGLRVGQVGLLVAVARMGTAKPGDLCRFLRMEKSTLSRDVELMRRNGWLEVGDAADRRARPLAVTAAGAALLEAALPAWEQAQDRVRALLGPELAETLGRAVDRLGPGTGAPA